MFYIGGDLIRCHKKERHIMVKTNNANRLVKIVYIFNPPRKNLDLRIFIRRSHTVNVPHT